MVYKSVAFVCPQLYVSKLKFCYEQLFNYIKLWTIHLCVRRKFINISAWLLGILRLLRISFLVAIVRFITLRNIAFQALPFSWGSSVTQGNPLRLGTLISGSIQQECYPIYSPLFPSRNMTTEPEKSTSGETLNVAEPGTESWKTDEKYIVPKNRLLIVR